VASDGAAEFCARESNVTTVRPAFSAGGDGRVLLLLRASCDAGEHQFSNASMPQYFTEVCASTGSKHPTVLY
jgi:hypothetical protein